METILNRLKDLRPEEIRVIKETCEHLLASNVDNDRLKAILSKYTDPLPYEARKYLMKLGYTHHEAIDYIHDLFTLPEP